MPDSPDRLASTACLQNNNRTLLNTQRLGRAGPENSRTSWNNNVNNDNDDKNRHTKAHINIVSVYMSLKALRHANHYTP